MALLSIFSNQRGLIRGTVADEKGNLTLEKEGLHMEVLPVAQAVKNSGGIVVAQVESVAAAETLNAKEVKVPGILIDYIVVSKPDKTTSKLKIRNINQHFLDK